MPEALFLTETAFLPPIYSKKIRTPAYILDLWTIIGNLRYIDNVGVPKKAPLHIDKLTLFTDVDRNKHKVL
jgi:hypothetical protein